MEKNGNTLAPGDDVVFTGDSRGVKLASSRQPGKIITVDPETNQAHVKFAAHTQWIDLSALERQ